MKLSVIMPSNNIGLRAHANILNASSLGSDDVEVIIRDNSGNKQKREFISQIHEKNCRITSVERCSREENIKQLLAEVNGEFVFFVADCDIVNRCAIPTLVTKIDEIRDVLSIAGVTGVFAVDDLTASQFVCFDQFEKPTALERFEAFFKKTNYSFFQHSPIRARVLKEVLNFDSTLPVHLSFHDGMTSCLLLMHGIFLYMQQYMYQYDNTRAYNPELRLKKNALSYQMAGLDSSGVRLHWLLAAFEGVRSIENKYQGASLSHDERKALSSYWFGNCFPIFQNTCNQQTKDAKFDGEASKIASKWQRATAINLNELLTDIAEYFALSSPAIAKKYYDFWK